MLGREIYWDEMVQAQNDLVRASFDRIHELSRRYVEVGQVVIAATTDPDVDRPGRLPIAGVPRFAEEKLAAASRRLTQAEGRFARQVEIVTRLSAVGRVTDLAEELLEQLRRTLEVMRESRLLLFGMTPSSCGTAKPPEIAEQVGREHTLLEAVLRHLPAGVLIAEAPSGRVLFHNDRLAEILAQPKRVDGGPNDYRGSFCFASGGPLARALEQGVATVGEEVEFARGDNTTGVAAVHATSIRDAAGLIIAGVAVFQDVTERKADEMRVKHMALHDPLTGLANRALFHDRLTQALARARRASAGGGPGEEQVAVMVLDLDGFKDVNDTLGHETGDRLLRAVATSLGAVIRASDTLARLGGDEFAVVQAGVRRPADAAALADKLLLELAAPCALDGETFHVTTSIGIAQFPRDGVDGDELLRHADLALYRAKARGRNRFAFFESGMDAQAQARRRLERELRLALERGEFVLHYQPQLDLGSGRITGAEALVRWRHPERGLMLPGEFIPLAEANALIRPLGAWVLREACQQARVWREQGWRLTVAVNLSPVQLRNGYLLPAVAEALLRAGLEPARLELELTEGVLLENLEHGGDDLLQNLTAEGVRLAIDDFGIGYSSLAYLQHLPVQTIKIDRSFVNGLGRDPTAEALVRAIVTLGHSLGKRVVAEGVETPVQLAALRTLGCDAAQGFLIAEPQPSEQLTDLLALSVH